MGEGYSYSSTIEPEQWRAAAKKKESRPFIIISLFRSSPLLGGFLIFLLALQIISFFTGPLTAVPDFLKTTISLVMAVFVALFFYGILLGGLLDLIIIWLFPKSILGKAGLEKYEAKILWLASVAANIGVFFFTNVIPTAQSNNAQARFLDGALRIIAAAAFPVLLALNCLRELMRYKKVKANTGELSAE
jgi:hypothetical protein